MTRALTLVGLLAIAACSGKDDGLPLPAKPPTMPQPVVAKGPPPPEKPTPAPIPEPVPMPEPKAAPRPLDVRPDLKPPARQNPIATIHLPAFTLRTLDRSTAAVEINGEELSTTPCLWSITSTIVFDEKIVLGEPFPPDGARYIGVTTSPEDPQTKAEVYVVTRPEILAKFPSIRKDECLLLVKGNLKGSLIQGGLRLRVEGCRFTVFTPLVDPEGEEASRLVRTLWFERTPNE